MTLFADASHRRLNPLTREWVLVSPHRTQRPWQGQVSGAAQPAASATTPTAISAPATGAPTATSNPDYAHTFVFANDFAALQPAAGAAPIDRDGLIVAAPRRGICRVVCFSPRHDLTLARMSGATRSSAVVDVWIAQYRELGRRRRRSARCRSSRTAAR